LPQGHYEVTTVDCGLKCLQLLDDYVPDVLVLDWELPWGGAEGVLEDLRNSRDWQHIPVIITGKIASFQLLEQLGRLLRPPVVKFLAKPFDRATLAGSIRLAMSTHQEVSLSQA
jgi:CheY-like chemotaxis protein